MRVLNVIASADPATGGPLEGLRLNSEAMLRRGHISEVVTVDDPAAGFVGAFPFPVHACGPQRFGYGFATRLIPWITQNADRFDVAVIHGLWNWASVGGSIGLRRAGLPYLLLTHGMMDPWFRQAYPLKHRLKQALWLAGQGQALRDANAVLFTCEEERRLAHGVFRGFGYREKVVAYGVADPPPPSEVQKDAFRKAVPSLGDRPYLLFLSRIHQKKGCDLLVEAFSRLAAACPGIDLVMAGPDRAGLRPKLENLAAQNGTAARIHWPGMLQGDAKWGAFYGADAFVLPSHQENFGIAVVEAMACGTPVLITDKVNIWREVELSGGGLVDDDTLDGVHRLISRWLSMPADARQAMRRAARAAYEKNYRIETAAESLLEVLQDAAKGP